MIFRVILIAAPDALSTAIGEAIERLPRDHLSDEELDYARELGAEMARAVCAGWFGEGGRLTVEVDTYEGTCRIVEVDEL